MDRTTSPVRNTHAILKDKNLGNTSPIHKLEINLSSTFETIETIWNDRAHLWNW